jgi:hypothetical protein
LSQEATVNAELLDNVIFGAKRMELIGRRAIDALDASQAYTAEYEGTASPRGSGLSRAEVLIGDVKQAHQALAEGFRELWFRENRPFALDVPMGRFQQLIDTYAALEKKLGLARKAFEAGEPLPSPSEVGLEVIELGARRCRPHRVESAPLNPDEPWQEPSASHRLALTVKSGTADRRDLPLEMLVRVPDELIGKPARAFASFEPQAPVETPAQLDATGQPGLGRLVVVLPGVLAKDRLARLAVYVGLGTAPARLATAVSTSDGENGTKWIENDRVRLLLGPQGAHLFRWEIRGLENRDVTMPGETGWFGFSDMIGENREAQYRLVCQASGPAMVRYECANQAGLTKVLTLFAGTSWVEATLSSPTGYYWDFDNPDNFAADGPTPGDYLFSNGQHGRVGRKADALTAQVRVSGVNWAAKYLSRKWVMAMVAPEALLTMVVAPGAGAGGVGVEGQELAGHIISYAGAMEEDTPADLMNGLARGLDFRNPPEVTMYAPQKRE